MKNLIVYYSYEGNTEELVKGMKDVIEADMLRLKPKKEKISKSMFRFLWGGMQVYMTKRPELEDYDVDLSQYDNIIIGLPCWFGTYAPPINTFLTENKIQGKKVYLFVCNGGNLGKTFVNYEKVLAGNEIVSTLDLVYPLKKGIEEAQMKLNNWIKDI